MIFDAHGDIWTDVTVKRQKGERNVFKKHHLKGYEQGQIKGGIFVIWVDPPYDKDPMRRTIEIIENMSVEIIENQDIFQIIRGYEDIEKAVKNHKLAILIGMEGLSAIGKNVDLLNAFYMFGARHASLTWNEENELGTGSKGNPDRGITKYGIEAVKKLEQLGMIVDVSHANEKTFWGIHDVATKPFIASHSNCKALCDAPRNLTDEQLKAIAKRGGVVGLNAFSDFVHGDKDKRDIEHLMDHMDHMVGIMGIDHVGFGFDFNDYLEGSLLSGFADEDEALTKGLENVTKVPDVISMLQKRGYSYDDIEKIKYKNFFRVIKEVTCGQ
ncbi:dipeptidase [Lutibacter sp. B2]|nr:dipeptidase [Lutibacter sp. B2]